MPDLACKIMSTINEGASSQVMSFHQGIGLKVHADIKKKQSDFLRKWVQQIPKISILAILWNESTYLNDVNKQRQEKAKQSKGELDTSILDPTTATAYMMQIATELGQGLITEKEFYSKQRRATMQMTFSYVALPKVIKEELIEILLEASESNPFFSGVFGESILAMMPSYLMMAADVADLGSSSEDIFNKVTNFVSEVLYPLYKNRENDRLSEVMYNILYSQSVFLRITNDQDKHEANAVISRYAAKAVAEDWSDELVTDCCTKSIGPELTRIAYQQIDITALVQTMVHDLVKLSSKRSASTDEILNGAFIIAISLQSQASFRSTEIFQYHTMTQIVQMISMNDNKNIPESVFANLELEMNEPVQPILDIVENLYKRGVKGSELSPKEVLATFALANAEAIKECLKHIGNGAQSQRKRENCGYYPIDHLPVAAAAYLSKSMVESAKYIKDDRAEQPSLAILVSLAETSGDVKQAQKAVDQSLAITEGKVTELTPVGIPEALAAMYQEKGDMKKSLYYYKLALDGIRTFILRQKTDAIVLNAVLVQAQFDKKEALKMAFNYSPFFSDTQPSAMVGPGRKLLVQQCEQWAKELSLSLEDARGKLLTLNVEGDDIVLQDEIKEGSKHDTEMSLKPNTTSIDGRYNTEEGSRRIAMESIENAEVIHMASGEVSIVTDKNIGDDDGSSLPKNKKKEITRATMGKKSCASCSLM